ncbi:hypothetical protein BDA99DRAFT_557544 [Phascolomyces articulosus]|uniref:Box C/D snoRNA protein 1 n=1 Tax=Phascolomyces articulosus TaxID=60185 RepID=A0AAD5KM49_9FUNG|nr:hypothetical protein BDA99DRAFT_557544 [Phascolomyces articulosus]
MDQNQNQEQPCQICHINLHKYKCPRCSIYTCSVDCVKRHKQESDCSGERDKTHFVSREEYNYSHMMSDYTYLEDVSRRSDTLTRERYKAPAFMDHRSKLLMKKARDMGIQYDVLPAVMTRHKSNKTNYSNNIHQMFWTVECRFSRGTTAQKILEHSIPQAKSIRGIFENMLFAENPQGKGDYKTIRYQVREFKDAGIEQFVVGLKKEGAPKNTFVNLTPHLDKPLRELLRGERVIEFPTIYIWLQEQVNDDVKMEEKVFVEHNPRQRSRRHSKDQQTKKDTENDVTKDETIEQPATSVNDQQAPEEVNDTSKETSENTTVEKLPSPIKVPTATGDNNEENKCIGDQQQGDDDNKPEQLSQQEKEP